MPVCDSSDFLQTSNVSCVRRSIVAPGGGRHRIVIPIVDGDEILNGSALVDPECSSHILKLWWPDHTVARQAIRVTTLDNEIVWTRWIGEPLMLSFVKWTIVSFSPREYESICTGPVPPLQPLNPEEARFVLSQVIPLLQLPSPDDAQYCIPCMRDDASGYSFLASLRNALASERDEVTLYQRPQCCGVICVGIPGGEMRFEWGLQDGRRCIRFTSPCHIPFWFSSIDIHDVLATLDTV